MGVGCFAIRVRRELGGVGTKVSGVNCKADIDSAVAVVVGLAFDPPQATEKIKISISISDKLCFSIDVLEEIGKLLGC